MSVRKICFLWLRKLKGLNEGWVARFSDGRRYKIKTAEYFPLHRLILDIQTGRIRDLLMKGEEAWQAFLELWTDEFL